MERRYANACPPPEGLPAPGEAAGPCRLDVPAPPCSTFGVQKESDPTTPAISGDDARGACPACGYFVGAGPTCVRCGARIARRISVRLIRVISVVGSIVGVVALWFAAYSKQPHEVRVGSVDEMMNGALVKISGKVTAADENRDKNTLRLKVDDGTGEITASAFNKLSQFKKVLGDRMPGVGDEIELVGTLNVTQKFGVSMFLSVPDRVKVLNKYTVKSVRIGDLTKENVGDMVALRARVASYDQRSTRSGMVLHAIVLADATGTIDMTLFDADVSKLPDETRKLLTEQGPDLDLTIKIGEYRGRIQAELVNPSAVIVAGGPATVASAPVSKPAPPEPAAAPVSQPPQASSAPASKSPPPAVSKGPKKIGEIESANVGNVYDIAADVVSVSEREKGTLVTVSDGTGEIKMMIWKDQSAKISGFDQLKMGVKISGPFKIDEFHGHVQLKVDAPERISIK